MTIYTNCPRCGSDLTSGNYMSVSSICSCGWCDPAVVRSADQKIEKAKVKIMIGTAIGMIALFGHFVSWGNYSGQIPFTKAAQWTGLLSEAGHVELANACIGLNKWDCATEAYIGAFKTSANAKHLASLASMQTRLNDSKNALVTYGWYIKNGGNDSMALLKYGTLLESEGNEKEALQTYEKSIAADPQILPVQATTAIVRLLMKEGRYEDAYKRVTEFRESAGNAKGYLNTELSQLETVLKDAKKTSKRRA